MITFSRNSADNSADNSAPESTADAERIGLFAGWKRLLGDSLSLAGLQARLFSVDGQVWFGRVRLSSLLLLGSMVLGFGSLPLLLGAAVVGLNVLGMHMGWALLLVGVAGLALAVIAGTTSWNTIAKSLSSFDRSREEFSSNIQWVRERFLKPDNN